ncbi:hypothetical protein BX616_006905 [Lobosporangium transversale]|uniref:Uncharacterized protein n=1 Tax=Lobosporangium transversale TaxID=64571 RepID=A0A1Y2GGS0_9FUNG|nr:hypothetical protein BCR41DRAFT_399899 [Lobosporangium transversale]KAF9918659.1 hypothetical protein BX616_006905 [Lobosporangium transversale]ORZ07045.1 hypothetical protein BCR41DRAFT_399899 [Lobosporangium transversale]|eukprot:XP_021877841.1 hypothetical protein BCR41DRAFT_399899 [Lobosporangium transversale]
MSSPYLTTAHQNTFSLEDQEYQDNKRNTSLDESRTWGFTTQNKLEALIPTALDGRSNRISWPLHAPSNEEIFQTSCTNQRTSPSSTFHNLSFPSRPVTASNTYHNQWSSENKAYRPRPKSSSSAQNNNTDASRPCQHMGQKRRSLETLNSQSDEDSNAAFERICSLLEHLITDAATAVDRSTSAHEGSLNEENGVNTMPEIIPFTFAESETLNDTGNDDEPENTPSYDYLDPAANIDDKRWSQRVFLTGARTSLNRNSGKRRSLFLELQDSIYANEPETRRDFRNNEDELTTDVAQDEVTTLNDGTFFSKKAMQMSDASETPALLSADMAGSMVAVTDLKDHLQQTSSIRRLGRRLSYPLLRSEIVEMERNRKMAQVFQQMDVELDRTAETIECLTKDLVSIACYQNWMHTKQERAVRHQVLQDDQAEEMDSAISAAVGGRNLFLSGYKKQEPADSIDSTDWLDDDTMPWDDEDSLSQFTSITHDGKPLSDESTISERSSTVSISDTFVDSESGLASPRWSRIFATALSDTSESTQMIEADTVQRSNDPSLVYDNMSLIKGQKDLQDFEPSQLSLAPCTHYFLQDNSEDIQITSTLHTPTGLSSLSKRKIRRSIMPAAWPEIESFTEDLTAMSSITSETEDILDGEGDDSSRNNMMITNSIISTYIHSSQLVFWTVMFILGVMIGSPSLTEASGEQAKQAIERAFAWTTHHERRSLNLRIIATSGDALFGKTYFVTLSESRPNQKANNSTTPSARRLHKLNRLRRRRRWTLEPARTASLLYSGSSTIDKPRCSGYDEDT